MKLQPASQPQPRTRRSRSLSDRRAGAGLCPAKRRLNYYCCLDFDCKQLCSGTDLPVLIGGVLAGRSRRQPPHVQVVEGAVQHAGGGGEQEEEHRLPVVQAGGGARPTRLQRQYSTRTDKPARDAGLSDGRVAMPPL